MDVLRRGCNKISSSRSFQETYGYVASNPRPFLYGFLFLLLIIWLSTTAYTRAITRPTNRTATPDLEKPPARPESRPKGSERQPGVWIPQDFKRPPVPPYPNWDVHTTKPLPYRPFKYGPKYHVTMGLRTMQWDEWIELDNHFSRFHADKAARIQERGSKCCKTAPEGYDAAVELLEELCAPHPHPYPLRLNN